MKVRIKDNSIPLPPKILKEMRLSGDEEVDLDVSDVGGQRWLIVKAKAKPSSNEDASS